jgi:hypothetical protein
LNDAADISKEFLAQVGTLRPVAVAIFLIPSSPFQPIPFNIKSTITVLFINELCDGMGVASDAWSGLQKQNRKNL